MEWLFAKDLARRMRVSVRTIRRWELQGKLPPAVPFLGRKRWTALTMVTDCPFARVACRDDVQQCLKRHSEAVQLLASGRISLPLVDYDPCYPPSG